MGKRAPNARGRGRGAGQTSPTIKESKSQICTSGGRGRGKKDASAVLCTWCKRFRFSPCPLSGKPIMWRYEAGAQCRVCARRIANSAQLRKEAQSGALEKNLQLVRIIWAGGSRTSIQKKLRGRKRKDRGCSMMRDLLNRFRQLVIMKGRENNFARSFGQTGCMQESVTPS